MAPTVKALLAAALLGVSTLATLEAQARPAAKDQIYAKAKTDLPEDYYVLYRIVDRISRANDMAQGSWRVRLSSNYALNGFAEETNLIIVPKPSLEQLAGDPHAQACMVAREMSHHIRKHKAIGPSEKAALKSKIQAEVLAATQANENSKRTWGLFFSGDIQTLINQNTDRATAKMIAEKEAELNQRMADTSRRIEKEADEDAFIYLTRASFDPKGCIRYLDLISRDPSAEPNPSNPQIPARIQAYREFVDRESPVTFKKEGSANLVRNVKPLTYAVVDSGASLRINAAGGTSKEKIDSMF